MYHSPDYSRHTSLFFPSSEPDPALEYLLSPVRHIGKFRPYFPYRTGSPGPPDNLRHHISNNRFLFSPLNFPPVPNYSLRTSSVIRCSHLYFRSLPDNPPPLQGLHSVRLCLSLHRLQRLYHVLISELPYTPPPDCFLQPTGFPLIHPAFRRL